MDSPHFSIGLLMTLLVSSCMNMSEGAKIELTVTRDVIKPGLTKDLTMLCSLESTWVPTVIGRDVIESNYNPQSVNSIIISRVSNTTDAEEVVAKIVMAQGGQAYEDIDIINVTGSVLPNGVGGSPYLQLHWNNPLEKQTGQYICEINTLDPQGHAVIFKRNISIDYQFPSDVDILRYVVSLEDEAATILTALSEVQMGFVDEGLIDIEATSCSTQIKNVDFCSDYANPPAVDIGTVGETYTVNSIQGCTTSDETGYSYEISNVTTTGFQIKFTPSATTGTVHLRWTSYPRLMLTGNSIVSAQ